ncbi:MAG: YqaE/Pmp3 family membrane protein [Algicola sp.]|nr:YqaE/Pmp3 family membrane protein [Algicola sp.]
MSLLTIILSVLLPPVAVLLKHGVGKDFLINILLTLLGWIPGVIHAIIVNK